MTSIVVPRPDYFARQINEVSFIAELRNDPGFMEIAERSMQARLEGRVQPWSQVKKELDIR